MRSGELYLAYLAQWKSRHKTFGWFSRIADSIIQVAGNLASYPPERQVAGNLPVPLTPAAP